MSGSRIFRVLGVSLKEKARVERALTAVYGIGKTRARAICGRLGINPNSTVSQLPTPVSTLIRGDIESHYTVGPDLHVEIGENISNMIETGSYRGQRHLRGLPVNGQATDSNHATQAKLSRGRLRRFKVRIPRKKKGTKKGQRRG